MKNEIEQTLGVLVGLPVLDVGRASDLIWIHFGAARQAPDHKGNLREVGEYALHLLCPWRIVGPQGIVVGSHDLYYPASDQPHVDLREFKWDRRGVNRLDEQISRLLQARAASPLAVLAVEADAVGSLRITMNDEFVLEVFPDDSIENEYFEYWRFFDPGSDGEHFVVTRQGVGT